MIEYEDSETGYYEVMVDLGARNRTEAWCELDLFQDEYGVQPEFGTDGGLFEIVVVPDGTEV